MMSPSCGVARRTPCSAMAPMVVDAAALSEHTGRHAAHQVSLHRDPIGVIGLAGAGAGDQIARREIGDAFADGNHFAGRGVADAPSLRIELARRQPARQRRAHLHVDEVERQPRGRTRQN